MAGVTEIGLRERSKARRRAAILRAAYQLFAERGYDATTVADIAAAAEVAPRTIALYFPAKQDIALSRFDAALEDLNEALAGREPGQRLVDVIGGWLRGRDPSQQEHRKQPAHAPSLLRRATLEFWRNLIAFCHVGTIRQS